MRDDQELLRAHQGGDETAFGEFYERHRRQLHVYLVSVLGRRDVAEDVLQETFLGFLARLDECIAGDPRRREYRGYLVRAARSRAIDELRRRRRRALPLGDASIEGLAPIFARRRDAAPGESRFTSAGFELGEHLERALRHIPGEQREVVILKALVGLSFPEIATLTGVSEKTADSRYRYGIRKLRESVLARGERP